MFAANESWCTIPKHGFHQGRDKILYESMPLMCEANNDVIAIGSTWSDNWFVGISGGANAFIGKPLGCEDLFGRVKPTFGVSLGKWITPSIGGRLYYQGMQFKDCNLAVHDYQHLHADLLWNVLGGRYGKQDNQHLGIVPYVGVGLIHNKDNGQKPFTLSYGILGQYRITKRLTASLEIGNATTFQEFDGYGKVGKFGDNMMSLTAGLSVNISKVGWKRVGKTWGLKFVVTYITRCQMTTQVMAMTTHAMTTVA